MLCSALYSCAPADPNAALTEQAKSEYLTPVHPGGEARPFWNGFAKKFIYARNNYYKRKNDVPALLRDEPSYDIDAFMQKALNLKYKPPETTPSSESG